MARINIEDSLWSDPRFMRLCIKLGDEMRAVGAVVLAWRVAQKYWCPDRQPIPSKAFETAGLPGALIDCGLAEDVDGDVRMRGSDEHFAWWFQRQQAGAKGGQAKASKGKRPLATAKRSVSGVKQNVPSSSSSFSFSNSSSDSSISNSSNSTTKVSDFVAAYCDRFKTRWGDSPQILGKDAGIAKRLAKDLSLERFCYLLDAYFQMPDAWLVKIKHPLATFETKLNEVLVFAESGKFTTQREVRQADDMASNYQLLEKIKSGEL